MPTDTYTVPEIGTAVAETLPARVLEALIGCLDEQPDAAYESLCAAYSQRYPDAARAAPAWTIARVKAELPDVPVCGVWGTNMPAVVRGRTLPFARVQFYVGRLLYSVEVGWPTIVAALNAGRPLQV